MKHLGYVAYTKDAGKIAAHRPSHRQYLTSLLEQGKLLAAGPFTDDSGALFIYEADSPEAAAQLLAADPFSRNGVIVSAELRTWKLVMSNAEAFRV